MKQKMKSHKTNPNSHPTINQTKNLILKEARKLFRKNIETIKALNFKVDDHSSIGESMLDDYLNDIIYFKYMPTAYNDLIEWTRQEPILISKILPPSIYREDENILNILIGNTANYLKIWFYSKLDNLVNELR